MTINEINYIADYTIVWGVVPLIIVFCYLNRNIIFSYQTFNTNHAPAVVRKQQ